MKNSVKFICSCILILVLFSFHSCKKDSNTSPTGSDYVVLAWNSLGMHCLNPTYDQLVILPPYNTIYAQVIKRGNPPEVLTSGIKVKYRIMDNTYSYGKRQYGGFWDYSQQLFGTTLEHDKGLTGSGLSGEMAVSGNQFVIEGVPVVPVTDNDTWNPYQVAEITVVDQTGNTLITTRATVPTSDEINCAGCHGDNAFEDILTKHDSHNGTNLLGNQPVLCASCHPSPALGTPGTGQKYLSEAIHGFHATTEATCYNCHPGQNTKCNRSLKHTSDNGNCTTCHGELAEVGSSITNNGRVPWVNEPKCASCHTGVDGVDTGNDLYRNSEGHGNLACPACHGSPHTMFPSSEATDNYQPLQYQDFTGKVKTIGSCGICHDNSRGPDNLGEFSEAHGGSHPEETNACHVCHTQIPSDTSKWPHAHTWKNSN